MDRIRVSTKPSILGGWNVSLFTPFSKLNMKQVEYDQSFMYLIDKAGEEKVPLKNINKIKATMNQFGGWFTSVYKIEYTNESGAPSVARCSAKAWFGMFSWEKFATFKRKVKEHNPNVKIVNFSTSFDTDQ